jgi:hypothetical protein
MVATISEQHNYHDQTYSWCTQIHTLSYRNPAVKQNNISLFDVAMGCFGGNYILNNVSYSLRGRPSILWGTWFAAGRILAAANQAPPIKLRACHAGYVSYSNSSSNKLSVLAHTSSWTTHTTYLLISNIPTTPESSARFKTLAKYFGT